MAEVDRLEVKVEAQARGANSQLDNLANRLGAVKAELGAINYGALNELSNSVSRLASAMQKMNGVKTTDFSRLSRNIETIGNINVAKLTGAANAMSQISRSFNRMGTASKNAAQVAQLSTAISKLGNKSVAAAITNIPNLSTAISNMMRVLSGAPKVSKNVIDMTNAMASLSANGAKVGSTAKNLSTGFKQYADSTRKAKTGSRSLASVMGSLYANFWTVIRAVKSLGSSISSSMDYIEEYNYFNVTMDKVASEWSKDWEKYGYESAEAYGNSFQGRMVNLLGNMTGFQMNNDGTLTDLQTNNLGLDVTALTNYSAGIMQVTNSLGLTGEASTTTSKALTMLAGDMSSFRNLDLSTVMTNFQSGLIGQSRALYKYGIDITNATLETYAYENGITKAVSEMTQAEKMQLRLIAILDQSQVAWGDLANTINSPSNQLRLLQNNFSALSRTIGNIFLPVVARILPYINGLTIAVRRLFTWIASLLGVDLSGIIDSSSSGYTDAFEGLEDEADDTSSSIDGTTDSVKKLKSELLGIDEITKLSGDTDTSSGSSSSSGGSGDRIDLTDQLSAALANYESVWNESFNGMSGTANQFADDIVGFFQGVAKYAEPSVDAVKRLWDEGLSDFIYFSAKGAQDFMDNFLIPLGKWALGKGLPNLIDAVNDFLEEINWTMLNKNINSFWKAMEPFAEGIGNGLIKFFKGITAIGARTINLVGGAIGLFAGAVNTASPDKIEKTGEALGILLGSILLFKGVSSVVGIVKNVKDAFVGTSGLIPLLKKNPSTIAVTAIVALTTAIVGFTGGVDSKALDSAVSSLIALSTAIVAFKAVKDVPGIINAITGTASSGLTKLITFVGSNSTALCVSALAALVSGIISVNEFSNNSTPMAKYADEMEKSSARIKDECEEINESLESIEGISFSAEVDSQTIQTLADKYFELADKARLTNSEQQTLVGLAEQLVQKMPELAEKINLTTGAYNGTKNEIQEIIDKTKESYRVQALQEQYVQYIKENYKAQVEYNKALDEQKDASNKLAKAKKALTDKQKEWEEAYGGFAMNYDSNVWNALERDVNNATAAYNESSSTVTVAKETVDRATQDMEYCWSQMTTDVQKNNDLMKVSSEQALASIQQSIKTSTDNSSEDVTSFFNQTATTFSQLGTVGSNGGASLFNSFRDSTSGLNSYGQSLFQQIKNTITSTSTTAGSSAGSSLVSNYMNSVNGVPNLTASAFLSIIDRVNAGNIGATEGTSLMNELYNSIKNGTSKVQDAMHNALASSYELKLNGENGYNSTLTHSSGIFMTIRPKGYADGGFPTTGQYFLARENGPELVGNIGGRTTVVNNSQIVESIKAGVKEAVIEATMMAGSSGTGGETVIQNHLYIDGEQVAETVNRYNRNSDIRFNPIASY